MKNNSKSKNYRKYYKYEYLLYAILWIVALAYPFFHAGEMALEGESFQWTYILQAWGQIVPFAVLLLIHAFVLLPILLVKKQIGWYALSTIILIGLFFIYSDSQHHDTEPRHSMPPFRTIPRHHRSTPADEAPMPFSPLEERADPRTDIPDNHRIPAPVIIDTFVALLLMVCNSAIKLIFKHYESMRRMEELEKTHIKQELAQLKAQITPHFFMNSLNNIHGMVEIDPQKAQDLILELSGMMRYVLYESASAVIVLSKEIDFLRNYISLVRVRYAQNRVAVEYKFPDKENVNAIYIPPLIFIIFIENAFKHGVNYRDDSFVDIDMQVHDSLLTFRCINSCRHDEQDDSLGGVGLNNIRKRLDILYGDDYTLNIDKQEKTFHVTLTIPTKNENQMHSRR